MKNLTELSKMSGHNVIAANQFNEKGYHLLIDSSNVAEKNYYTATFFEGQKMGITLKGTPSSGYRKSFKKQPVKFLKQITA